MPIELKGIRVFIASPGGLDAERTSFRSVLSEFNEDDGHERGVSFIPIGWELARAGMGRPQEKINEDVRSSDYLVLVLSDRWGTPPSEHGAYTSGTEEEYNVARQCIASANHPMRDILVLFKGVDAKQLSDPGTQLSRVLDFKKKLEQERTLLFQTFDSPGEFERHLRRALFVWAREGDDPARAVTGTTPPPTTGGSGTSKRRATKRATHEPADLVEQADGLAKAGRLVEAESAYARAVVGRTDTRALVKYVRFLRRNGRLDQARALSERLLEMANDRGEWRTSVEAYSNLAIVERKLGNLSLSLAHLRRAIRVAESAGDDGVSELAFLFDNVGLTERKLGHFDEALEAHMRALSLREGSEDARGRANSLNHAGALLQQRGDFARAEQFHRDAVQVFDELGYERGQAQALANLGEDLLSQERWDEAAETLNQSLRLNVALKSPEGMGMNYWQLGRLALVGGDRASAYDLALRALEADDSSGRPEGVAGAQHLLGQIDIASERPRDALVPLRSAQETYKAASHRLGEAWTWLDIARAYHALGERSDAVHALRYARIVGGSLGHAQFDELLRSLADEVEEVPK